MLHSCGFKNTEGYSPSLSTTNKMAALEVELSVGLRSLIISADDGGTQYNLKEDRRSQPSREPHYMTLLKETNVPCVLSPSND